jgi:ribosomal protein S14
MKDVLREWKAKEADYPSPRTAKCIECGTEAVLCGCCGLCRICCRQQEIKAHVKKEREALQAMAGKQEGVLKGILAKLPADKRALMQREIEKRVKDPKILKVIKEAGL